MRSKGHEGTGEMPRAPTSELRWRKGGPTGSTWEYSASGFQVNTGAKATGTAPVTANHPPGWLQGFGPSSCTHPGARMEWAHGLGTWQEKWRQHQQGQQHQLKNVERKERGLRAKGDAERGQSMGQGGGVHAGPLSPCPGKLRTESRDGSAPHGRRH